MAATLNPAAAASLLPPTSMVETEAAQAEDAYIGATVDVSGDGTTEAAAGEEEVEKVVEEAVIQPTITGVEVEVVQEVEAEAGVGKEESQKEPKEEEIQKEVDEVVVTHIEVGVDEEAIVELAEVGEKEDMESEGGTVKGVNKEKETTEDMAVEMEVEEHGLVDREAEVGATNVVIEEVDDLEEEPPKKTADEEDSGRGRHPMGRMVEIIPSDEEEEDQSALVKRPRSARRTRTSQPTPLLRELTPPPREVTPSLAEQSLQLEERQVEEPVDDSENERGRLRQERKRKGKLLAQLVKKKAKPASPTVAFREPSQITIGRNRRILEDEEETSEDERQRAWEIRTRIR